MTEEVNTTAAEQQLAQLRKENQRIREMNDQLQAGFERDQQKIIQLKNKNMRLTQTCSQLQERDKLSREVFAQERADNEKTLFYLDQIVQYQHTSIRQLMDHFGLLLFRLLHQQEFSMEDMV